MNPKPKAATRALACMILAAGCQMSREPPATAAAFAETVTTVASRGVAVPVTFIMPRAQPGQDIPLVVMAHGHGGSREEAGGFTRVAEALAGRGIASIRMDFPGCGDSMEPFTQNDLSNMLADISASLAFALEQPQIEPRKVAILGYSMGGRLALLATTSFDYRAIVTWAPVGTDGAAGMHRFLGGRSSYDALKSQARQNGNASFTTPWGQQQYLGPRWFADMEASRPLAVIGSFKGALLVVHGREDEVIAPRVGKAVVDAAVNANESRLHIVDDAGHGFGFYDDRPDQAAEVVEVTLQFLQEHLADGT